MPNSVPKKDSRGIFNRVEEQFKGKYSSGVFDTIRMAYSEVWVSIFGCLVVGLIGRALLLGNANIIGYWVDSFCVEGEACRPTLPLFQNYTSSDFILLLSIFTLVGFILIVVFRVAFSRISARAVSQIYDETTLRTSRLPMSFYDRTPAGRTITRFSTDYNSVFRLFGGPLAEFFSIAMDLLLMMILISVASIYYSPLVLLMALASYTVYRFNRPRLKRERREMSASRSPGIAHFAETAQGASAIRAFRRGPSFMSRFAKLNDRYLLQRLKTFKFIYQFSFQMNLLTGLLLLATGILAYYLLQMGLVSIGSVGVAFGFILLSGNTLHMLFEWMSQLEEALVGVERLDFYLRQPLEKGARLPATRKFQTDHPVRSFEDKQEVEVTADIPVDQASLEVKNLWLRYRDDLPWVLKGVDFSLKPGERLGVIGRTGSGKTTLIQSLFYLYPFSDGEILLDGKKPRLDVERSYQDQEIDIVGYRQAIGFITQEPSLFQGSLRENLTIGDDVSDQECYKALEKVGLKKRIYELGGLNFEIEEKGRNLSSGEKQLICMARCLLQKAPIIIMDEATSSVDPQNEEILVRATEEFFTGKTQIIVAHRLSTLQHCHRTLWLDEGKIKMLGPTNEVLEAFQRA